MGLFDKLKEAFKKPEDYTSPLDECIENAVSNEEKNIQNETLTQSEHLIEEDGTDESNETQELETSDKKMQSDSSSNISDALTSTEKSPLEQSEEMFSTPEAKQACESIETDEANQAPKAEQAPEAVQTPEDIQTDEVNQARESKRFEVEKLENKEENDRVIKQEEYTKGLEKTRKSFSERLNELFANFRSVDEDFFEEVEETLIASDVGFETSMKLTEELRNEAKLQNVRKPELVQNMIIEKMVNMYEEDGAFENNALNIQEEGLTVMLFVGVNGVGKTTSIGKLAHSLKKEGKKVMLAAADTFRAGAIAQLAVWGERAGVEVVKGVEGGDPASVVYDAMERAKNEGVDVLLVDTAGRLQNKAHLMNELDKIKRVIQKSESNAPHEVLLALDATTGQNALVQAKEFKETTDVTGLVLTKLDGTAKGGIILAIRSQLHIPVKLVGLGEGMDDLKVFSPEEFVLGMFKDLVK